ncbi:MAG: hypothetical protein AAFV95_16355 [Bacteroidota bacterium]
MKSPVNTIFLLLLCLCGLGLTGVQAQPEASDASDRMSLKMYGQLLRLGASTNFFFERPQFMPFDYFFFKPALSIQKAGSQWIHELEPNVRLRDYEADGFKETYISLRYELGKSPAHHPPNQIQLRLGYSAEAFYYNGETPRSSVFLLYKEIDRTGLMLSLIPHLQLPLFDRFFLDLNVTLLAVSAYYEQDFTDNPIFTESQKTIRSLEATISAAPSLGIGLGFDF